jgi:hypothetical protein
MTKYERAYRAVIWAIDQEDLEGPGADWERRKREVLRKSWVTRGLSDTGYILAVVKLRDKRVSRFGYEPAHDLYEDFFEIMSLSHLLDDGDLPARD